MRIGLHWKSYAPLVHVLPMLVLVLWASSPLPAAQLQAGAAKVDITNYDAGPVNDPLHARALVVTDTEKTVVLVAVDAVAIGEIGYIANDYLPNLRARIERELRIPPSHVLVNASHCHGVVCTDVGERTFEAVRLAHGRLVPVKVGAGAGHEDRIMENRRLILKDGRQVDVRHAYSLPADEEVAAVGPVDPEIGVLRLDALDGRTVAVVYNFACHPIQGVPGGGNTADVTGFSSRVIEENLGPHTIALFLQGCGGDVNPVGYKVVDRPRDAEPLGNLLGLSTLRAVRQIEPRPDQPLKVVNESLALPRADFAERIAALEQEQSRLVQSLRGTSLNLRTFLPLVVKYRLSPEFPSDYSQAYLHEAAHGRDDLASLDAENRRHIEQYIANILTMEQLTRVQTNLALLRKHQAQNVAAGTRTLEVELLGLRLGDCVLTTFPGELTVEIGLNLKGASPHELTFVAGYTNGYIYYAPTAEQLQNAGAAQEDCDCLLAPEWQGIYEAKAGEILRDL